MRTDRARLGVVLFSGGRGSDVLSRQLVKLPDVALTIAINGYDDGASTGEVRRFFGDCLGPSDFRKNASRVAGELQSCPEALVALQDLRLPVGCSRDQALSVFEHIAGRRAADHNSEVVQLVSQLDGEARQQVSTRLEHLRRALESSERTFDFSDCALGNLVFAGSFLACDRRFNNAVDDYCGLLGVPTGLIDNVTDGTNAFLVALDVDDRLLGSEADIVDAKQRNRIKDIFLIDHPLRTEDRRALDGARPSQVLEWLHQHARPVALNPRVRDQLSSADLIIYSPGTQHSSLFPSYLTNGLSRTIASNLTAVKLLVTNIQADAEIAGSSAVDIIERAVYYLQEKGALQLPTPSLITHYIINDPSEASPQPDERGSAGPTRGSRAWDRASLGHVSYSPVLRQAQHALSLSSLDQARNDPEALEGSKGAPRGSAAAAPAPYVDPGRLDALEDPRLVRVGHYEDGVSGRHDASKVLTPFLNAFLSERRRPRVAIWLYDAGSLNKLSQSVLEMLRGGLRQLPVDVTTFYTHPQSLDEAFVRSLPFPVRNLGSLQNPGNAFREVIAQEAFDYAVLFESSGMYNGEDVIGLLTPLATGRLDAVWGSRRLSVKEIEASLRLRYRHNAMLRMASYVGSHLLSFAYLLFYGRYISDTLSGARAVRTRFLTNINLDHKLSNQHVLSAMLGQKADVLETPVHFLPLSPERVRRTSVMEGLQSLGLIAWRRLFRA